MGKGSWDRGVDPPPSPLPGRTTHLLMLSSDLILQILNQKIEQRKMH